MSRLTFPAPIGPSIAITVGVAALTLVQSVSLLSWAYADWTAVSALPRQVLTLVGPWVAGGSAWVASTFVSDRSILAPTLAARRGVRLVARHVAVLTVLGWIGLAMGLAPVVMDASLRATWGGPDLGILMSGLMALSCAVAFGYTIGTVLPLLASVPSAVVMTFVATVFYSGATGSITSPTYPFGVVAGLEEPNLVTVTRVLYFALAVVFLILIASTWLRNSIRPIDVQGLVPAILAVVVVAVCTSGLNSRNLTLVVRDTATEGMCSVMAGVRSCVHPARQVMLDDIDGAVGDVKRIIGPAFPLDEVVDSTLWQPEDRRSVSLQLQSETSDWRSVARADIANAVTSASFCASQGFRGSRKDPGPAIVSQALALWIARQTGATEAVIGAPPRAEALANRLEERRGRDLRDQLKTSLPDIRSCQGEIADIL